MWYWIFKYAFLIFFKTFFRLKVEGLENLPKKTNFVIVSNHTSWLDPICFVAIIPYKFYGIAARFLYRRPVLRWFCKRIEALSSGDASLRLLYLLDRNENVGLFPEGGCSRNGKLRKFRNGAALLGLKTGRPIVPCAILGTYEILPVRAKFPKFFKPIKVKIGKPVYLLKAVDADINEIALQEGTFKIRKAVEGLINAG